MALNYFIGWSQEDLETELRAAQEELARGKNFSEIASEGTSSRAEIETKAKERIELLLEALYLLDPDTYPLTSISRTTRTKGVFS